MSEAPFFRAVREIQSLNKWIYRDFLHRSVTSFFIFIILILEMKNRRISWDHKVYCTSSHMLYRIIKVREYKWHHHPLNINETTWGILDGIFRCVVSYMVVDEFASKRCRPKYLNWFSLICYTEWWAWMCTISASDRHSYPSPEYWHA